VKEPRHSNSPIDEIAAAIEAAGAVSPEEMQLVAQQVVDRYNNAPVAEFGDLSPYQVRVLTQSGWLGTAVELNSSLKYPEVQKAPIYRDAVTVLKGLGESGPVKATATGALNRAFVQRVARDFAARGEKLWQPPEQYLRQTDLPMLDLLRHLLPAAGLILYRNKAFTLTRKASALLREDAAGELFSRLFHCYVTRINIGALDGLPDYPPLQWTLGYTLYQLSKLASEWTDFRAVSEKLFLPAIVEEMPELRYGDKVDFFAEHRVIRTLLLFGLVEIEREKQYGKLYRIRKSLLFDRFLRFECPPASGPPAKLYANPTRMAH
jgi:hypothetical protein